MKRKQFLQGLLALTATSLASESLGGYTSPDFYKPGLKTSLNAYSFNDLLIKGKITLDELLEFCAARQFDAIDITGYYFKSYPSVPADDIIFGFKRKAHRLGLGISGTGVRNDFTHADPSVRKAHVETVKAWTEVAAKLGAPVLRIFTGLAYPPQSERRQYTEIVAEHISQCLESAKSHGVIIAIQNHHDFIRSGDEVIELLKLIDSPWLGLVLDIGSYRGANPYDDIRKTIPYAVNWQIKEKMFVNDKEQLTDLKKIFDLIKASAYRGYLPIETLGAGDPFKKVPLFLNAVKKAMI